VSGVTILRGYRRIVVSPELVVGIIQRGTREADPLDVIPEDLEIEDARLNHWVNNGPNGHTGIELIVSSTTFQEKAEMLRAGEWWDAPTWVITYRAKAGT